MKRYTQYDERQRGYILPMRNSPDGYPILFMAVGKTHYNEAGLRTGKEPDFLYGEMVNRFAELENDARGRAVWTYEGGAFICSACRAEAPMLSEGDYYARTFRPYKSEYCPNCGAKMN